MQPVLLMIIQSIRRTAPPHHPSAIVTTRLALGTLLGYTVTYTVRSIMYFTTWYSIAISIMRDAHAHDNRHSRLPSGAALQVLHITEHASSR